MLNDAHLMMTDEEFMSLSNEELIADWQSAREELMVSIDNLTAMGLPMSEIEKLVPIFSNNYRWKNPEKHASKLFDGITVTTITYDAFIREIAMLAKATALSHRAYEYLYTNNEKFYISRIRSFCTKNGNMSPLNHLEEMLSEIASYLPSFFPYYDASKGLKYCTFIGKFLTQPMRNVLRSHSIMPLTIYQENLLFRVNRVIAEYTAQGTDYDVMMVANKLGIGYKAVHDILAIKKRMESSISLNEVPDGCNSPIPISTGSSLETEYEQIEMRRAVNLAAERAARDCGDPRLSVDAYVGIITGSISLNEVCKTAKIDMRSYVRQKVDEFIHYFRTSREIRDLELAQYFSRASSVDTLETVINDMPLCCNLSVSTTVADKYMDELTSSLLGTGTFDI